MANTLTIGESTPSKNLPEIISINIDTMTTILGLFLALHASVHQEADWAIFFSLLTALSAVMALVTSRALVDR
jgi:hypothetical protein